MKRQHYFYGLLALLLCLFAYLTRSYTKTLETEKIDLKTKLERITTDYNKQKELNIKLSLEINKLKETNIDIIDIKNKDGSSKKITKIRNKQLDNTKQNTDIKLEDKEQIKKEEVKQVVEKKEERKKETIKKSNWVLPLTIIGGIALCIGTGICVF